MLEITTTGFILKKYIIIVIIYIIYTYYIYHIIYIILYILNVSHYYLYRKEHQTY